MPDAAPALLTMTSKPRTCHPFSLTTRHSHSLILYAHAPLCLFALIPHQLCKDSGKPLQRVLQYALLRVFQQVVLGLQTEAEASGSVTGQVEAAT